jgi:hypothetical protein
MMGALENFLARNSVGTSTTMPAIHTTNAYNAKRIIKGNLLSPQDCTVFKNDSLTYLFYGRPSYKYSSDSQVSKYWELPSLFIFDYTKIQCKRIFPFDSGAHNIGLYPNFLNMMPLEEFEVNGQINAPERIVGSFFVDTDRYFRLKPRDRRDFESRYGVTSTEEEILALHDLAFLYSDKIDDRRFAIELQTEAPLSMNNGSLMAIIIPEEYYEDELIVNFLEESKVEILTYPTFSLKQEMYYHTIYNILFEFYRDRGLVR